MVDQKETPVFRWRAELVITYLAPLLPSYDLTTMQPRGTNPTAVTGASPLACSHDYET